MTGTDHREALKFTLSAILFAVVMSAPIWSAVLVYVGAVQIVSGAISLALAVLVGIAVFVAIVPLMPGEQ